MVKRILPSLTPNGLSGEKFTVLCLAPIWCYNLLFLGEYSHANMRHSVLQEMLGRVVHPTCSLPLPVIHPHLASPFLASLHPSCFTFNFYFPQALTDLRNGMWFHDKLAQGTLDLTELPCGSAVAVTVGGRRNGLHHHFGKSYTPQA